MIFPGTLAKFSSAQDDLASLHPVSQCSLGLILLSLLVFRLNHTRHFISWALIDGLPLAIHLALASFRESVKLERKYETSFLICNCGEFHGTFDRQGLVELAMAIMTLELVIFEVPLSLLRLLEVLFLLAVLLQLYLINVLICLLVSSCFTSVPYQDPDRCVPSMCIGFLLFLVQMKKFGPISIYSADEADSDSDEVGSQLSAIAKNMDENKKKRE